MKVRTHIYVSGRVQGVSFRYFTQIQAKKRSIVGWVRNLPDGRVEAFFEGEKKDVDDLIELCHNGSPAAPVENVETHWEGFNEEFKEFKIR